MHNESIFTRKRGLSLLQPETKFHQLVVVILSTLQFRRGGFIALSSLSGIYFRTALAETNPIISLENGLIQGITSNYIDGVNIFKGIRFADPATGGNSHLFRYWGP